MEEVHTSLKETWEAIEGWDNEAAECLRNGTELICCEHTDLTTEQKEYLVDLAQSLCNDDLEVDEGETELSRSESGGYWVRAWLYLPDSIQAEQKLKEQS